MKTYHKTILKDHLFISVSLIALIICVGTVGYVLLEGLTPFDAVYHTVTVISTVGFSDLEGQRQATKVFTMALILAGVAGFYYMAGAIVEALISGRLFEVLKLSTIEEKLSKARDHVIICGYGDVGAMVVEKVGDAVIIERDEHKYSDLITKGYVGVLGDSTAADALGRAGVKRAKAMIVALDSDPEVVFTILTAKEMNPSIKIYARANDMASVSKMKKAGADYVICLPEVGSRDLVNALRGSTDKCLAKDLN